MARSDNKSNPQRTRGRRLLLLLFAVLTVAVILGIDCSSTTSRLTRCEEKVGDPKEGDGAHRDIHSPEMGALVVELIRQYGSSEVSANASE